MTNAGTQLKDAAIAVGIVAGVSFVGWTIARSFKFVDDLADKVETDETENIISRAADASVDLFTGENKDLTIGDRVFKFFNPKEAGSLCNAGQTQFCTNRDPRQ